jgi:NAD(P)-dependent dehydrogenase (short-subunit alcohol dehydrogenase family)
MRRIAVTGSASGIGAAIRARLEDDGAKVIGVDLRDAEVIADLSRPGGRSDAIAGVRAAGGGRLDGLVVCAGVGPHVEPWSTIVSINYFGAYALLEGLRETLARGDAPAAVAVGSNSATVPGNDTPLVAACLAGEEDEARRLALELDGHRTYGGSKLALLRWVRRHAPRPGWAGAGVRLNAVAPGPVLTPLLEDGLAHPIYGPAIRGFPVPLGGFGAPAHVAACVAFLLGPQAAFCSGTVLFVDGGTDALFRPDAL